MLKDIHDGLIGGHFTGNTNVHKVMRVIYYWPTLFKGAHVSAQKCLVCQRCVGRDHRLAAPFLPISVEEPFQQCGLDAIGEIFPHSSKQLQYILTATYYFAWWTEAVPLRQVNDQEVI